eukprot:5189466-Prymnesium_polylepis.1
MVGLQVPPSTKQLHSSETEMTQPVVATVSYDVPARERRSPICAAAWRRRGGGAAGEERTREA